MSNWKDKFPKENRYFETDNGILYCANVLEILPKFPDESIDCIITSPPYWGLRDYGEQARIIWNGDKTCKHEWESIILPNPGGIPKKKCGVGNWDRQIENPEFAVKGKPWESFFCKKCGAWYGQLGLEPTLDLYIKHLFEIMKELKRVLKKTGVIFWNHNDCYGSHSIGKGNVGGIEGKRRKENSKYADSIKAQSLNKLVSVKDKCMALQNYRFILKCVDELGLILRNIIIWYKPNHIPSSVKDRFTNAYEPVFMLVKNKKYWFDLDAVRVPHKTPFEKLPQKFGRLDPNKKGAQNAMSGIVKYQAFGHLLGKNPGDLWEIPTQPFSEAHFACVDALTEALTPYGWKKWNELKKGDLICAYDKELGVLKWERIEMIATYSIDTELIHIGKRDLDILVTPDHRTLVKKRNGELKVIKAEDIAYSDKIPVSAYWKEHTHIPSNWAYWELTGWFLSDGTIKKDGSIEIYQSKPKGVKRIKYLLHQNGIKYSVYQKKKKRGNFTEFVFYIPKDEALNLNWNKKEIKNEWLNLDIGTLNSLFWGLVGGDGHIRKDDGRICFIQKDKEFIDKFQIIAIRLGFHCIVSQRKDGKYCVYMTKKKWIGIRGTNGKGKNMKRIRYKGIVWCPKVSSTFWLARRNGKPFITGNTFPEKLVEPMIKCACPQWICKKCGFIRERVYEKLEIIGKEKPASSKFVNSFINSPGGRRHYISIQRKYKPDQKEIARFIKKHIDSEKKKELDKEFGRTTWEHWVRTDDTGACLPSPEQYLRLKEILKLPDTYDKVMLTTVKVIVDDKGSKDITIGWTDCGCNAGWESGIVLDPFISSGTVAVVAERLGRRWIGIETVSYTHLTLPTN